MKPVAESELEAIRQRHGMRAWAHILILQNQRGRALNRNQIRCITLAVGDGWLNP